MTTITGGCPATHPHYNWACEGIRPIKTGILSPVQLQMNATTIKYTSVNKLNQGNSLSLKSP